jgi:hypothetical protein
MPFIITPQYVGVGTAYSHTRRALEFTEKTDVYVAFGKTSSWPDDNVPPDPDPLATQVDEVVGYKKVTKNVLVVPDNAGTIEIYGVMWREVAQVDAYTELARHVWVQGQLNYDEFPVNIFYREIGIYTGLVREATDELANPGRTALLPAHVDDPGILEYIYNDKPIPRHLNRRDIINVVLTF